MRHDTANPAPGTAPPGSPPGDGIRTSAYLPQGSDRSPAVSQAYRSFADALRDAELSPQLRELIALAVAPRVGCAGCLRAAEAEARALGLSEGDIRLARVGRAENPEDQAALQLALALAPPSPPPTGAQLARLRELGFTEAELAEIVAVVALNLLAGALERLAGTAGWR